MMTHILKGIEAQSKRRTIYPPTWMLYGGDCRHQPVARQMRRPSKAFVEPKGPRHSWGRLTTIYLTGFNAVRQARAAQA
jgi:hypothetical protein